MLITLMPTSLAYAEMRLLLAKMLWNFDFELENPEVDWHSTLRAYLIWDRTPLKVRLQPVKR
jgi:cytochrome P450